jgi:DNA-binding MarR family transcriptional regulator
MIRFFSEKTESELFQNSVRTEKPEQNSFTQIPLSLYEAQPYREITPLSRQLYGLLRYRTCLAEKYGWEDEKGRRYIYCTIRQISEELGCSVRTAGKLITELQEKGFLEKERQGQGKPKRDNLADTTDPQASLLPT